MKSKARVFEVSVSEVKIITLITWLKGYLPVFSTPLSLSITCVLAAAHEVQPTATGNVIKVYLLGRGASEILWI